MEPLVSILIPAYNAEEWLSETLRSAIAQTWPRKEIIVVDDGSTDGTLALARSFESEIVKVFTHENQGAAATRNRAFSLCQGDYIQWLDADDLLGRNKIARQMEALNGSSGRTMLVSGEWGSFMYRPDHARFKPTGLWCNLSKTEWLTRKLEQNAFMQTACWLVSRELCRAAGPWDTRLLGDDDGEYFCRVLMASSGVRFVPGAKVYYRQSGSASLSYIGNSERKRDAQWISMKLHIAYLRSLDDSRRARLACIRYLQNWAVVFYPERLDIFARAEELSRELGGALTPPPLSWKYSWIKILFGWPRARKAEVFLQGLRWNSVRLLYRTLFRYNGRARTADLRI